MTSILIGMNACQKSIEEFTPYSGSPVSGDSNWVSSISGNSPVFSLKNDLRRSVYTDNISIIPGASQTFPLSSGLLLSLPPGSLYLPGTNTPITGQVTVLSYLLRSKGDMIRMSTTNFSGQSILSSSEQLFISLRKDSSSIILSPSSDIEIRCQQPLNYYQGLGLYKAGSNNNFWLFNWEADTRGRIEMIQPNNYKIHTNSLGWMQVASNADTLRGNLTIQAELTPYNTNANTLAFLIFDNFKTVLPLLPNNVNRKFLIGDIAPNQPAKLVVISKMGNNYYWGIKAFTTAASTTQGIQPVSVTPRLTSLDDILMLLDAL
jgi:hypothetical protein